MEAKYDLTKPGDDRLKNQDNIDDETEYLEVVGYLADSYQFVGQEFPGTFVSPETTSPHLQASSMILRVFNSAKAQNIYLRAMFSQIITTSHNYLLKSDEVNFRDNSFLIGFGFP